MEKNKILAELVKIDELIKDAQEDTLFKLQIIKITIAALVSELKNDE